VNQNKAEYYRLLQVVRDEDATWEKWVLFMLDAIEKTSYQTIKLVRCIRDLMHSHKKLIREKLPKIYSQDLLNNLFRHPYTKVEFLVEELQVSRVTASKYLNELVRIGILSKHKKWKENYYLNESLFELLSNVSS
jgi:Fic family protein